MKSVLFPGTKIVITTVKNGFVIAGGYHEVPVAIAENLLDIGAVLDEYFTLPTLEDQDAQEPHDDRGRSEGPAGDPIDPDFEEVPGTEQIGKAPGTNEDGSEAEAARPGEAAT